MHADPQLARSALSEEGGGHSLSPGSDTPSSAHCAPALDGALPKVHMMLTPLQSYFRNICF
jgi:hypothetical protein